MSDVANPFHVFGLKPDAEIDMETLDQIYHALQQATHPDRFTSRPLAERQAAALKCAEINSA